MDVTLKQGRILDEAADLAILATYADEALPEAVAALIEADDYKGNPKQTALIYPRGAVVPRRVLLVGLGKRDELKANTLRQAAAIGVQQAQKLQAANVTIGVHGPMPLDETRAGQAIAEGLVLGAYRFLRYRTNLKPEESFTVSNVTLLTAEANAATQAGVTQGLTIARGVTLARDLVNTPGGDLTPPDLANAAVELGQRVNVKVTVLDKAQLEEGGFGGILAVGRASKNEPRFIIMEYGTPSADTPTICLVGKGLTFDSGGLSIKPADAMTTMKSDMGGSATVLGTMQVVAELGLPIHLVGLIPSAENMIDGNAYRVGDIIKTLSGKTIEVLNTDAEGRIVLADALHYAQRYQPKAIIEFSTLTGAVIIALGAYATGMMGTDQALMDALRQAGEATSERVWQLPLWDEYKEMIKSEIADIKNVGGRPAGSITAGAFLANFVGEYPFVHFDIAATSFEEKPTQAYNIAGGTGVGVRLMVEYLQHYAK